MHIDKKMFTAVSVASILCGVSIGMSFYTKFWIATTICIASLLVMHLAVIYYHLAVASQKRLEKQSEELSNDLLVKMMCAEIQRNPLYKKLEIRIAEVMKNLPND